MLVTRLVLQPALLTALVVAALRLRLFVAPDALFLLTILLSNATPTAINMQVCFGARVGCGEVGQADGQLSEECCAASYKTCLPAGQVRRVCLSRQLLSCCPPAGAAGPPLQAHQQHLPAVQMRHCLTAQMRHLPTSSPPQPTPPPTPPCKLQTLCVLYNCGESEMSTILFWQYLASVFTLPALMRVFLVIIDSHVA